MSKLEGMPGTWVLPVCPKNTKRRQLHPAPLDSRHSQAQLSTFTLPLAPMWDWPERP